MVPLDLVVSTYLLLIISVVALGHRHPARARVALVAASSILGVDAVAELLTIILPGPTANWVAPLRLTSVLASLAGIAVTL